MTNPNKGRKRYSKAGTNVGIERSPYRPSLKSMIAMSDKYIDENFEDEVMEEKPEKMIDNPPNIPVEIPSKPEDVETIANLNAEIDGLNAQLLQAKIQRTKDKKRLDELQGPREDQDPLEFTHTCYLPSMGIEAKGLTKKTAYDAETGDSYDYVPLQFGYVDPDKGHHVTKQFSVRLDCMTLVPAMVADTLRDRADLHPYNPERNKDSFFEVVAE